MYRHTKKTHAEYRKDMCIRFITSDSHVHRTDLWTDNMQENTAHVANVYQDGTDSIFGADEDGSNGAAAQAHL